MHIPGGFLSDPVCAITSAASAAACGASLWRARRSLDARGCQSLAAAGAVIFAAQMINFPVDHGTSGHLLAAGAVAIVLGPLSATLAMGVVLAVQAALLGDGGFSTWGANLLSMGIAAPWTAWAISRAVTRRGGSSKAIVAVAALGGFASVLAAASVCSLELAAAGTAALGDVLPAMLQSHLYVGLSEALLTAALVAAIRSRSSLPLLPNGASRTAARRCFFASAAVALLVAPWASTAPDGLESVAARLGFADSAASGFATIAPDYVLPGVGSVPLAIGLAGLIGVATVFAVSYAAGRTATCRMPKRYRQSRAANQIAGTETNIGA
jgi:cobalt/nickel transport system permease protein